MVLPEGHPIRIQLYKNEEQDGKGPQTRSPVAKERQRNTYCRKDPDHHANIHEEVNKEYPNHAVAINPVKLALLSFCEVNKP